MVTVELLRKRFIAAQLQRLCSVDGEWSQRDLRAWYPVIMSNLEKDAIKWSEYTDWKHFEDYPRGTPYRRCHEAAQLYVIARDQGINAALLFKLGQD